MISRHELNNGYRLFFPKCFGNVDVPPFIAGRFLGINVLNQHLRVLEYLRRPVRAVMVWLAYT